MQDNCRLSFDQILRALSSPVIAILPDSNAFQPASSAEDSDEAAELDDEDLAGFGVVPIEDNHGEDVYA